jgi:hypothetical protein
MNIKKWMSAQSLQDEWTEFKKVNKIWLFIIAMILISVNKYVEWREDKLFASVADETVEWFMGEMKCLFDDARKGDVIDVTMVDKYLDTSKYILVHENIVSILKKKHEKDY